MAFCEKCGQSIPDGQTLCESCAASQPVTATVGGAAETTAGAPQFQPNFQAAPPVQPAYVPPVQPAFRIPLTQEQLPAEYKPLGAWTYFLYDLLFMIPVVGLVCLIVFACGGTQNINLRHYARSFFCWILVMVIVAAVVVGIMLLTGQSLNGWVNFRHYLY